MNDDPNSPSPNIGYKRPPQASRFVPGQSGNPKGRPKGAKNFATVLEAELKAKISITENGKRKKISKREAIAKQLVNKAVGGDQRSIPILLAEARQREGLAAKEAPEAETLQLAIIW